MEETSMEKQKYRIAVMGAYGVGKTTFLGSYFNLVINKGEGVPVSLNTPEMVDQVARITGTLFKKQVPVTEKAIIENMAYSIETLGMEVEFVDVASSENFKTLPDLKSVNGILFFLSAEDLVKNPVKVKKDNEVFQEAIDYILQNSDSKWYDFQKFPLYCILTKCDAVPQLSEEELSMKTADFLNAAKGTLDLAGEEDAKPFLFEAGKNLRCFRTVSLGKWTDTKALPKKYEPENVLESMEDLYSAMVRVPRARKRVKRAAWAVGGLLILAFGSSWGLDIYKWEKTKEEARKLASEARYEDAVNHVKAVADRNDKNELISEIYKQYEKAKFDGLFPLIKDLDVNVPPEAPSEAFSETSKKVEEYLKNSSFKQANAANYEKVESLAWYFEAGKKLLSTTPEETLHAADALNKWIETLPRLPEQWKGVASKKTKEMLESWFESVGPEAEIEDMERSVVRAADFAAHPNLSDDLKALLSEKQEFWKKAIDSKWISGGEKAIAEAGALSPEEGLKKLSAFSAEKGIPENIRQMVAEAVKTEYARLADTYIADRNAGKDRLVALMTEFPEMPEEQRQKLFTRIKEIVQETVAAISEKITAAGSLEILEKHLPDLELSWEEVPEGKAGIAKSFASSLSRLWETESRKIHKEAAALASKNEFSSAMAMIAPSFRDLAARVSDIASKAGIPADQTAGLDVPALVRNAAHEVVSALSREIEGTESLEALASHLPVLDLSWEDVPEGKAGIAKSFASALNRLLQAEGEKIKKEIAELTVKNEFSAARDMIGNAFGKLVAGTGELAVKSGTADVEAGIIKMKEQELSNLQNVHYEQCRKDFETVRNTKDPEAVSSVISSLRDYVVLWPSSAKTGETEQVAAYLEAVKTGIKAELTIIGGDFSAEDSFMDSPDMKIQLKKGNTLLLETKTVENNARPSFNEKYPFTWDLKTGFTFVGIETAGMFGSDKEVFKMSVDAGGLFGYKKLNGTLKDRNNSLTVKLDMTVPDCPWK